MDKELINKYKAEFDLLLQDKPILVKFTNGGHRAASLNDFQFRPAREVAYFVIDDEYSEFRKALAEGKTVQTSINGSQSLGGYADGWVDVRKSIYWLSAGFTDDVKLYRIKPDEPKFKVGDWLRTLPGKEHRAPASIFKVESCLTRFNVDAVELWKPQPGEYCKFYDVDEAMFTVAPYGFCDYNSEIQLEYFSSNFDYCEPYLEPLPAHLQE